MQAEIRYHKISYGCENILSIIAYTVYLERTDFMAVAVKKDYQTALEEQKAEVRNLVIAGLDQIKEGKTKDFNSVCDRLEKKYKNEAI
ncbi:hypothetical protein D7V90_15455 [bacterium 1xD42-87]|nr:hypothetical protein D7V90_15455 [bacterium 1xD42-87]